ncbi:MAG: hypothetical protein HYY54_08290 [candidate division NC10 bacterium]|nr:hypothetical protein [candidate division NC10 bacterium]
MGKRWMRHVMTGLGLLAGAALLGGCPVVLLGGAAAVGGGVVYTQLNQAEKTFEADFARVEGATRQALRRSRRTSPGWRERPARPSRAWR